MADFQTVLNKIEQIVEDRGLVKGPHSVALLSDKEIPLTYDDLEMLKWLLREKLAPEDKPHG